MKRFFSLYLLLASACMFAQLAPEFPRILPPIAAGNSLPPHCQSGKGEVFLNTTDVRFYACTFTDTWTATAAGSSAVGGNPTPTTLSDAATISVDASLSARYEVTLGGSRTVTLTNPTKAYQVIAIAYKQDGTGSRTVTYSNAVDTTQPMCNLWPAVGTVTTQILQVEADGSTLAGLGCVSPANFGVESAAPTSGQCSAGVGCAWWDSTAHTLSSRQNGSSSIQRMVTGATQPFDSNAVLWIGADGSQNRGPVRTNRSTLSITEDFLTKNVSNYVGLYNWAQAGSGSTFAWIPAQTSAPSTKGHPGIFAISTGTSLNGAGYISLANGSGQYQWTSLGANSDFTGGWYAGSSILLEPAANAGVPAALSNMGACLVFSNSNGAFPGVSTIGIGICADTSSPVTCTTGTWSATNWNYVSSSSGSNTNTTCVDSGVAAQSATWYDFDLWSSTLGTLNFRINGAAAGTISTNVPDQTSYPLFVTYTRTTATKVLWIDYFQFQGFGLGRNATVWPN